MVDIMQELNTKILEAIVEMIEAIKEQVDRIVSD
jgi:hypothetical protein